jgi:putative ABC transport system permease protein
MIKFLIKGVIRDRSRSVFPLLTVTIGVILTVFAYAWVQGVQSSFIDTTARFGTGHVKIMSRAYAEEADQVPNDLCYIGVEALLDKLRQDYPDLIWSPRIKFGGLLDIPDEQGETRAQGPVVGMAVDLLSEDTPEKFILNLEGSVVQGRLPRVPGEILISDELARRLGVEVRETATLIGVTMNGSMAVTNFTVAGTIRFGMTAMDRGALLADLKDIQIALDMEDAAGEILGFFRDFIYVDEKAEELKKDFNARYSDEEDEFSPVMSTLFEESELGDLMGMIDLFAKVILLIFVVPMSIVLWNAGLMGSLRRYGEIGVRLAMGESKGHLYRSMLTESMVIGFVGSILGTIIGLALAYYLQNHGLDIGSMMKNSTLLISDVLRAKVTPAGHLIGFVPGLLATFLGTSIAGIGIYRRQTSRLMKELEV